MAQIFRYRGLISTSGRIIHSLERKLQKIGEIENLISDLYTGAETLYNHVNTGMEAIRGAWDGSGFVMPKNLSWKMALDTNWKNQILEKQIKAAKEKYMSVDDLGNKIYNWESIEEFMKKNPDEISEVEYAAMILVLDSMIAEKNGVYSLDTDNLEKFLALGYDYEYKNIRDSDGLVSEIIGVTASLRPTFQMLQEGYHGMITTLLVQQGHLLCNADVDESIKGYLNSRVYISGILNEVIKNSNNFSDICVTTVGLEQRRITFSLEYGEDESNGMMCYTLNVFGLNKQKMGNANIYAFNPNFDYLSVKGSKEVSASMRKDMAEELAKHYENVVMDAVVSLIATSIPGLDAAYGVASSGLDLAEKIQEVQETNAKVAIIDQSVDLGTYTRALCIGGAGSINEDANLQLNHLYVHEEMLDDKIAYYNAHVSKREQVTKEELMEDFAELWVTGEVPKRLNGYERWFKDKTPTAVKWED